MAKKEKKQTKTCLYMYSYRLVQIQCTSIEVIILKHWWNTRKKKQKEEKKTLSTNALCVIKSVRIHYRITQPFFFFFWKTKLMEYISTTSLSLQGGKTMWVSKHSRNYLDQGEQDFGLTRLTLEMISLEFSLCRAAETLTLQFVI